MAGVQIRAKSGRQSNIFKPILDQVGNKLVRFQYPRSDQGGAYRPEGFAGDAEPAEKRAEVGPAVTDRSPDGRDEEVAHRRLNELAPREACRDALEFSVEAGKPGDEALIGGTLHSGLVVGGAADEVVDRELAGRSGRLADCRGRVGVSKGDAFAEGLPLGCELRSGRTGSSAATAMRSGAGRPVGTGGVGSGPKVR